MTKTKVEFCNSIDDIEEVTTEEEAPEEVEVTPEPVQLMFPEQVVSYEPTCQTAIMFAPDETPIAEVVEVEEPEPAPIIRAHVSKPDELMFPEPTNHTTAEPVRPTPSLWSK